MSVGQGLGESHAGLPSKGCWPQPQGARRVGQDAPNWVVTGRGHPLPLPRHDTVCMKFPALCLSHSVNEPCSPRGNCRPGISQQCRAKPTHSPGLQLKSSESPLCTVWDVGAL